MNSNIKDILRILAYSSSTVSIDELQSRMSKSERSIKYYISELRNVLRKENISIINKRGSGYYIPPKERVILLKQYLSNEEKNDFKVESLMGRIMILLLFSQRELKVWDLIEEFYYDESSIRRFINMFNRNNKFNLVITNNKTIKIQGFEEEIREYYVKFIYESFEKDTTDNVITLGIFRRYVSEFDISQWKTINSLVKKAVKNKKLWVSEQSLTIIKIYLFVTHLRVTRSSALNFQYKECCDEDGFEFEEKILRSVILKPIGIHECQILRNVFHTNHIFYDYLLDKITENKLNRVTYEIIDILKENDTDHDYDYKILFSDLIPHLKQVLTINANGFKSKSNPLLLQIKHKYKSFFILSEMIYTYFCNQFTLNYSESEASYLTLYLVKNVKKTKLLKMNTLIVCGSGRGASKLIESKVKEIYPNIKVVDTISSFQLINNKNLDDIDFIISTIYLSDVSIPVVQVTSLMSNNDIAKVSNLLDVQGNNVSVPDSNKIMNGITAKKNLHELNKSNANLYSNIVMHLLETLISLPEKYIINQDKLLGITIHFLIALPRYFSNEEENNYELIDEVKKIETQNIELARRIDKFLSEAEEMLGVVINYSERYAIYQYILNDIYEAV